MHLIKKKITLQLFIPKTETGLFFKMDCVKQKPITNSFRNLRQYVYLICGPRHNCSKPHCFFFSTEKTTNMRILVSCVFEHMLARKSCSFFDLKRVLKSTCVHFQRVSCSFDELQSFRLKVLRTFYFTYSLT